MVGIPVLTTFFVLALGLIVLEVHRRSLMSLQVVTAEGIESSIVSAVLIMSSFAFVSGTVLALSVTKSMYSLAECAQSIARGDLTAGTSPMAIARNPEFAALGAAFAGMVDTLNKQFVSGAHNGVILVDSSLKVTFCNQNAADMLGLKDTELIGRSIDAGGLSGENYSELLNMLNETFASKSPCKAKEIVMNNGKTVGTRLRISTALFRDSKAGEIGISMWVEDVASITMLREDLQKLEGLVTLVSFVESVAHLVRNPLCSIRGHAQLLMEKTDGPSETDLTEGIINNVDIIDNIIRNFLDAPERDMVSEQTAQAAVRELRSALIPDMQKGA